MSNLAKILIIYLVEKTYIALFFIEKVIFLLEVLDFVNVFLIKSLKFLPKCIKTNKYIISFKISRQLIYKFIYYLQMIKFKIFKNFIENHLTNNFIGLLKSLLGTLIIIPQN